MKAEDKRESDRLVNIYLDGITAISNDAGWQGESMLAKLIKFQGEIPYSTGGDQSNMAMVNAIQMLREKHGLLDDLRREIGRMLGTYGENDKILALLSKLYYVGLHPTETDEYGSPRLYDDQDRITAIHHAPVILRPEDSEKAWENAKRYYRRRVAIGRRLLLERMRNV